MARPKLNIMSLQQEDGRFIDYDLNDAATTSKVDNIINGTTTVPKSADADIATNLKANAKIGTKKVANLEETINNTDIFTTSLTSGDASRWWKLPKCFIKGNFGLLRFYARGNQIIDLLTSSEEARAIEYSSGYSKIMEMKYNDTDLYVKVDTWSLDTKLQAFSKFASIPISVTPVLENPPETAKNIPIYKLAITDGTIENANYLITHQFTDPNKIPAKSGMYLKYYSSESYPNLPNGQEGGTLYQNVFDEQNISQIWVPFSGDLYNEHIYYRVKDGGNWAKFEEIATTESTVAYAKHLEKITPVTFQENGEITVKIRNDFVSMVSSVGSNYGVLLAFIVPSYNITPEINIIYKRNFDVKPVDANHIKIIYTGGGKINASVKEI